MIDRATIDKILDTTEIVDVIGDFVSLKRRGANYIACCPFHDEKTPSFSVSPTKGIYKCFGCGKAGNAVSFIMEHEQMAYAEAIKYLGKKYGIEVHEKEETAEDTADRLRHESLLAVSEFAQKFFVETLYETQVGRAVGLSYFKESRGFSEETIRKFGLGFSPDPRKYGSTAASDTFKPMVTFADAAQRGGYKKEFLIGTGLCIERENGYLVDKFYDRVMFPIHSLSGRVIAFGGRTLLQDKSVSKYVNSPETEIYHKSKSLYGIYFAKSAIAKYQKCYLVEGYTDVISMHQAGIENVVASSGTSLTTEQIRLIRRFTNKVTVLYDGDSAGIKASIRGIDMILEEGLEVKVALFPEGHDPDSFSRVHTREEIRDFLNTAETDFIQFKYELLAKDISKDPIRKAELIKEIIRTLSLIPDQITRTVYIEQTAQRLEIKQEMLIMEVNKARRAHIESGEYERKRAAEREKRRAALAVGSPSVEAESGGISELAPDEPHYPDSRRTDFFPEQKDISVPMLAPCEKEILYYLLKFGETTIHFEGQQLYGGDQPVMDITVAQYISAELENDDLELLNPLYKRLYDIYYQVQQEECEQEKIQHRLINYADEKITKTVLDIIFQEYTITVKEYLRSLIPEENVLGMVVPKTVLIYKSKVAEYTYQVIMQQLGQAQKEGNTPLQEELMQQIKILMMVKNQFAKELNRLT